MTTAHVSSEAADIAPAAEPAGAVTAPGERRFTGVDGLRGLAIIAVLFFHSSAAAFGLFGVDVFLVISGFFVTFLLLREQERAGRFRFGAFYARRAKRILPSLTIVVLLVLVLVSAYGSRSDFREAGDTAIAALFQVANWHQLVAGNPYWDATSQVMPMGQLWSLSVTEQFYLVGPLVIVLLAMATRRWRWGLVVGLSVLLAASAFVMPLLYTGSNADRLYLGTDGRAVSFIAGAVTAAFVMRVRSARPSERPAARTRVARIASAGATVVGFVTLLVATAFANDYREAWIYLGGTALVSVAAGLLTASLCFEGNPLVRVFSNKVLAHVGRLSYLLFLVHLPVYWLLQQNSGLPIGGWLLFLIGAPISWAVAVGINTLVAEPLRRRRWSRPGAAVAIATSAALIVSTGLFLPPLYPLAQAIAPAAANAASQRLPAPPPMPTFPPDSSGNPPTVVFVGDSMAQNFGDATATYASATVQTVNLAFGGCGIFDPESAKSSRGFTIDAPAITSLCSPWAANLRRAMASHHPRYVVLHNVWDAADLLIGGRWTSPCQAAWKGRFDQKMGELLALVRSGSEPATLYIMNERRDSPVPGDASETRCYDDALNHLAQQEPDVRIIDWDGFVLGADGKVPTATSTGAILFTPDGYHLTPAAKQELAPWLLTQLARPDERTTGKDSGR